MTPLDVAIVMTVFSFCTGYGICAIVNDVEFNPQGFYIVALSVIVFILASFL